MTPHNFIVWLDGYLSADQDIPKHSKTAILQKMKTVNKDYPDFSVVSQRVPPPLFINPIESSKVPYSTLCSCNPANGGSGICGCIQGNKLVEKDYLTRTNISMNTTELEQLIDLQTENIKNHEKN
jgi:hypothetical protein